MKILCTANTKFLLLCFMFALFSALAPVYAQQKQADRNTNRNAHATNYIAGQFIIRLADGITPDKLEREWCEWNGIPTRLHNERLLVKSLNIYLFSFDHTAISQLDFLKKLRADAFVVQAQNNHHVTMRSTIPNDPLFDDQWQYVNDGTNGAVADADIDADLAWDITTGGLTALGDTIVACVIDDGCIADHPDWGDNLWINHHEIPNNNIDDDSNGYVDDYRGWNTTMGNDNIEGGAFGGWHGTCVAGIVGAKGNNGIGVTGVCWNIKVMIVVSGNSTDEADVLASYSYPLEMRTRYNQSNGQDGAFVVSTNASWGIDQGQPADAPLWCAMYDELGAQGVISCGATANANFNVDVVGDLPTACPSDYLISVTNMGSNDVKITQAGYGLTTIDLGAFGEDTYTIESGGGYAGFGGTSGATPHVTGTVALLYSVPCPGFIQFAKADPAAAALFVKQAILNGTDANASLAGKCVTGGRLNLYNSVQAMLQYNCDGTGCISPYSVQVNNVGTNQATVNWGAIGDSLSFLVQYQPVGAGAWTTLNTTENTLTINGLDACSNYQVQVAAVCSDTLTSDYTSVPVFTTDGCCTPPSNISVTTDGSGGASVTWSSVTAASQYTLQLLNGGNVVQNINVTGNNYSLSNLQPCTQYVVQLSSACGGAGNSNFSAPYNFTTPGCGACIDNSYCASLSDDVSEEWIGHVQVAGIDNETGGIDEYVDYTNLSTDLAVGTSYSVTLTPAYASDSYTETFRLWIDFNQNGTFENQTELLLTQQTSGTPVTVNIAIPATALMGSTRMRISMKYTGGGGVAPTACETFAYGQVEDYCINIVEAVECAFVPVNVSVGNVGESTAAVSWQGDAVCDTYTIVYGPGSQPQTTWQAIQTDNASLVLSGLTPLTTYNAVVSCNCGGTAGSASAVIEFTTGAVGINAPNNDNNAPLLLMPNPFAETLTVKWTTQTMPDNAAASWRLIDLTGRVIAKGQLVAGSLQTGSAQISTNTLTAGMYWVEILDGSRVIGRAKAVKVK